MRIQARNILVCLMLIVAVAVTGCGGGSGGGSGSGGSSNHDKSGSPAVSILSGNNQLAVIGTKLDAPLVVKLADANGNPVSGTNVNFTVISGNALMSNFQVASGADGSAQIELYLGAGLKEVSVRAESIGFGAAIFKATPRLPVLDEVLASNIDGAAVAEAPAIVADLDDGTRALALLTGGVFPVDLSGLPTAGELAGAAIDGLPASDMPVVFVGIEDLVDIFAIAQPTADELAGAIVDGRSVGNLPAVLGFTVNADKAVLVIKGDASGIIGTSRFGDLLAANPLVSGKSGVTTFGSLPARIIDVADFPAAPDLDNSIYIALLDKLVPVFGASAALSGKAGSDSIPILDELLPSFNLAAVEITGGTVPVGVMVVGAAPQMDACMPLGPLQAIPAEYLPIVEIIENDLGPLGIEALKIMQQRLVIYQKIAALIQANQAVITDISDGNLDDYLAAASFLSQLLPLIDQLLKTQLAMLDINGSQLAVIKDKLLPAIGALLPADGIPFGGYSDGLPSSVSADVLPLINDQLALAIAALPSVKQLVSDIDAIIPGDGDLLALLSNLQNGGLDNVLADLDVIKGFVVDGLWMFNDLGIPMLYDVLEEVEFRIPPGTLFVRDLEAFAVGVAWLQTQLPPEAVLGDLPEYDKWGIYVAPHIPAELGDPATISIFNTIIPAVGGIDVGGDILPLVRQGLDTFAAEFPGMIDAIDAFSFADIDIPIPDIPL